MQLEGGVRQIGDTCVQHTQGCSGAGHNYVGSVRARKGQVPGRGTDSWLSIIVYRRVAAVVQRCGCAQGRAVAPETQGVRLAWDEPTECGGNFRGDPGVRPVFDGEARDGRALFLHVEYRAKVRCERGCDGQCAITDIASLAADVVCDRRTPCCDVYVLLGYWRTVERQTHLHLRTLGRVCQEGNVHHFGPEIVWVWHAPHSGKEARRCRRGRWRGVDG